MVAQAITTILYSSTMPFLGSFSGARSGRIFSTWSRPGAPTITGSTASNGALSIAFTAPSSDGGLAILKYQYSMDGTNWFDVDAGTTSPRSITGLNNGTNYTVRLRAVNAAGPGPSSNSFNDTSTLTTQPFTVPSAVGAISLSNGCTTATFSWSAPANNGRTITGYEYQTSTNGGSSWSGTTSTSSTSFNINVNNNTNSYLTRVRAVNAAGAGSFSGNSSSTTAWTYSAYTNSQSCSQSCSCGSCSCGSNNGTQTGTQSRTCYQYTRSGCTTTQGLNCGSFGACGSFGSCTSCSGCTSTTTITAPGTYNGVQYISQYDFYYQTNVLTRTDRGGCTCPDYEAFNITYCSASGVYTVSSAGCAQIDAICK